MPRDLSLTIDIFLPMVKSVPTRDIYKGEDMRNHRVHQMTNMELRLEQRRLDKVPWNARKADVDWEMAKRGIHQ